MTTTLDNFSSRIIGYARVSTAKQTLETQTLALKEAGATLLYEEVASGKETDRPQLAALLDDLRRGDTVLVVRLDRLGRSLIHLIDLVATFEERGAHLVSLDRGDFDTRSPGGRLIFNIFGALAEFERELISERTKEGLRRARLFGHYGGRPTVGANHWRVQQVAKLAAKGLSNKEMASLLDVSERTITRDRARAATIDRKPVKK